MTTVNGTVGHPAEDDGTGRCIYPGCGRRTGVYDGIVQHRRGSGGARGVRRTPLMPAHVARRLLAEMTAERDALRAQLEAERLDREQELVRLTKRIADLAEQAHPWVAVHAKLDALLKRPAGITPITHRRVKDGGVGGKRERRGVA